MSNDVTFSPSEFQQLPLDYVISAPLQATVEAQAKAAQTTLKFIKELVDAGNQEFSQETLVQKNKADGTPLAPTKATRKISVPILALTKVPNLNFDSLSIEFDYEINQVYQTSKERQAGIGGKAGGLFGGLLKVGLSGSISSKSTTQNTINKSGSLSVRLHASEAGMPKGLEKVINWMVQDVSDVLVPLEKPE